MYMSFDAEKHAIIHIYSVPLITHGSKGGNDGKGRCDIQKLS